MVSQFLMVKILTNTISKESFGIWNQLNTSEGLLLIFINLNMGYGFLRLSTNFTDSQKRKSISDLSVLGLAILCVYFILIIFVQSDALLFLFGVESVFLLWALFAILTTTIISDNIQRYLMSAGSEVFSAKMMVFRAILDSLFVSSAVLLYGELNHAIIGYLCGRLLYTIILIKVGRFRFTFSKIDAPFVKAAFSFGFPIVSVSLGMWISLASNRYFIGKTHGLELIGQYAVLSKMPSMILTLVTLLSTYFLTKVSKLYDSGHIEDVSKWFSRFIKFYFVAGLTASCIFIVGCDLIVELTSSKEYLHPDNKYIFIWVSISILLLGYLQIMGRLFDLEKKTKKYALLWAIISISVLIGNFYLIPKMGLIGIPVSMCMSMFIGLLALNRLKTKEISINIDYVKMIVLAIICLFTASLFYDLSAKTNSMLIKGLLALLSCVIVVLASFISKTLCFADFRVFQNTRIYDTK